MEDLYAQERSRMVEEQIKRRGVLSPSVLGAMSTVLRHRFVPEDSRHSAYEDHPVSIGHGQTISQPYIVAFMTELLDLHGEETVLEIGTGSGYQTAILAKLAGFVYTVESVSELMQAAQGKLEEMGISNVHFMIGDGSCGDIEHAPFDRIIVTAAAPKISDSLIKQLKDPGKMVIPVGSRMLQTMCLLVKKDKEVITEDHGGCVFVPLIGKEGWGAS